VRRVALDLAAEYGLDVIEDWPIPSLKVDCFVMRVIEKERSDEVIARLAHDPRTAWVQAVNEFHGLGKTLSLYPVQPSARIWHLKELHRVATGRGVRVAVIDSGVDSSHPDLANHHIRLRNFVDAGDQVGESHGTNIAGIIAASSVDGSGTLGVAPGVALMALRACWEVDAGTRCNSLTLARALQFAIDERAQVINLSLSGPMDRLLEGLIKTALAQGAVIVCAFDDGQSDGGFPASMSGVIAVSDTSAAGRRRTVLVAPGQDIPAPAPGSRWQFVSGSSYAAAHTSGMVALLLELQPKEFVDQSFSWIRFPEDAGNGLPGGIDACATLAQVAGACSCSCASVPSMSSLL
jgi:subtilisin family serine protease